MSRHTSSPSPPLSPSQFTIPLTSSTLESVCDQFISFPTAQHNTPPSPSTSDQLAHHHHQNQHPFPDSVPFALTAHHPPSQLPDLTLAHLSSPSCENSNDNSQHLSPLPYPLPTTATIDMESSPIAESDVSAPTINPPAAPTFTVSNTADKLPTQVVSDPLGQFDNYTLSTYMGGCRDFAESMINDHSNMFRLEAREAQHVDIPINTSVPPSSDNALDMQTFCRKVLSENLVESASTGMSHISTQSTSSSQACTTEMETSTNNTEHKKTKKKKKKMSKRELARAASAAEAAREQEIARLAKTCQISDEELLRLKPKKQRRAARFEKPVPSRFCHVCSRTPKNVRLVVCSRIKMGVCRKVICEKCFEEYGYGDFEAALKTATSEWTCPHCTQSCPERAQCRTYQRINDRLRVNRLKQEKPVRTRSKRKRGGTRVDEDAKKSKVGAAMMDVEGVTDDGKAWGEMITVRGGGGNDKDGKDEDFADNFVDDLLLGEPIDKDEMQD